MKYFLIILLLSFVFIGHAKPKKEKWISLFNGKNLKNWTVKIHHHEVGDNFGNTFRAEDGMIKVRYDQYEHFNERYGHLYYNQPFSNYILRLQYRFTGVWRKMHPVIQKEIQGSCSIPKTQKPCQRNKIGPFQLKCNS